MKGAKLAFATPNLLLNEVSDQLNVKSDYALGNALQIDNKTIHHIRTKKVDVSYALIVHILLHTKITLPEIIKLGGLKEILTTGEKV